MQRCNAASGCKVRVNEQPCMCAALNVADHAGYRNLCPDVLSHAAHTHAALGRDDIGTLVLKMLELELSNFLGHTAMLPAMPAPTTMTVPFGGWSRLLLCFAGIPGATPKLM